MGAREDLPEPIWAYDDSAAVEERPAADLAAGLTSLPFISAALRRCAWFWCATALAGFLVGLGLYVAVPPAYKASTSVLLTNPPGEDPVAAMLDNQAVAQSHTVAGLAMRKLGVRESVGSFLGTYTVTVVTDRVLLITARGSSSGAAVGTAKAVATEFLRFRADQLTTQQQLLARSLAQQITQAKQRVASIGRRLSLLPTHPASPALQAERANLLTESGQASSALTALEQSTKNSQASAAVNAASAKAGSGVLDPAAAIAHSRLKLGILYALTGLIAGLALGLVIIIVRALVSDRLRRRDDVANALGAAVGLSVGSLRAGRWRPGRRGRKAARDRDMRRIVTHLRNAVPGNSRGAAALAVVAVDNARVVAPALVSLAASVAHEGKQVVVADLSSGAPAAHLLGATDPGVRAVSVNGARVVVAVPDHGDVVPVGPLHRGSRHAQAVQASDALAAAYASADLLLTLVTLDPSLGGDHLATWATDVVAVVTAGRSSATRVRAVGQMI
ncbi:MAG TPA: hypothetical protein VMK13_00790, partial [Streptosporangiaceae bacterium]|nr:hypothetical protein [Streptosporangiaceae bacterium]